MFRIFNNIFSGFISILKGHWVTFINLFRAPITIQYPDERKKLSSIFRGAPIWIKEKCPGDGLCVRACPAHCIKMEVSVDENKKRKVDSFSIDYGLCMFCGLCEEACPNEALSLSDKFELASYDRESLIYHSK